MRTNLRIAWMYCWLPDLLFFFLHWYQQSCFCTEKPCPWLLTSALWCIFCLVESTDLKVLCCCFVRFAISGCPLEQAVHPLLPNVLFTFLWGWFQNSSCWHCEPLWEGSLKWLYIGRDVFHKGRNKCRGWWGGEVGMGRVIKEGCPREFYSLSIGY